MSEEEWSFRSLMARSKLVASGNINIEVNGEKSVSVPAGGKLLQTLAANDLFLASACGGGGTCAQCKCIVLEGGGSMLPTEESHFSRREAQDGWRLSCQTPVKQDMKIVVPEEVFGVKQWECTVESNPNVATFIKELTLRLPEGESVNFRAGGYVQLECPPHHVKYSDFDIEDTYRGDWERFKFFEHESICEETTIRAYSMANHPAEGNIVMLNIRIATPPWDRANNGFKKVNPGICSSYIFNLKPGDKVTVSGPYGEFFLKDNDSEMMFVGGGAGMAPMRSHLFHLFHTIKESEKKVTFWYGARSWKEVFYYDQFRDIEKNFPNFEFHLALDREDPEADKLGVKYKTGFVHQVIHDNYMSQHEEPEEIDFYMCGPPMMNDAVQKMLYDLGVPDENVLFDDFGS
mgnify:CR=1 FL=1